jgi:transcriptional regulator with GAF, ATPase, and Fis domain
MAAGTPGGVSKNRTSGSSAQLLDEQPVVRITSKLDLTVQDDERRLIEQALRDAEGRVAGTSGAAERLGVPASTLESKIRRFNIDKLRYRAGRELRKQGDAHE